MKYFKNSVIKLLLGFLLIGFATNAMAQNYAGAVQAYNKALELTDSKDYQEAINMYTQARAQAQKAVDNGEKGQNIIDLVDGKLPRLYYSLAGSKYAEYQKNKTLSSLNTTIDAFQEAVGVAEEYSDQEYVTKSSSVITKLLYTKSILQFRSEEYAAALTTLDQVTERDPDYAQAYYQKGIVVKKQEGSSVDNFLAMIDKAIEVGNKTNNSDVVSRAKESAAKELIFRGSNETENKNYTNAIELLTKALNYDSESANAHYRLAEAYNKRVMPDQAITHARQALDFENGGRTDKAKIYFELASALKLKGSTEDACGAYKNAAYGEFKSPSEHQMEYELKCESTTN